VVEVTTKGAVPSARVLVNWLFMFIVVTPANAPAFSVTVPQAPVPDEPLFLSIWLLEPPEGRWIFPAVERCVKWLPEVPEPDKGESAVTVVNTLVPFT